MLVKYEYRRHSSRNGSKCERGYKSPSDSYATNILYSLFFFFQLEHRQKQPAPPARSRDSIGVLTTSSEVVTKVKSEK